MYTIDKVFIGQTAEFSKTISESDVYGFCGITGDFNPAHIDSEYCKTTIFKKRIVNGMLVSSLVATVFGTILPGRGAIFISNSSKFIKPVYFNDTVTAIVEVTKIDVDKSRVYFTTKCVNQAGEIVLIGEACLMPPKKG